MNDWYSRDLKGMCHDVTGTFHMLHRQLPFLLDLHNSGGVLLVSNSHVKHQNMETRKGSEKGERQHFLVADSSEFKNLRMVAMIQESASLRPNLQAL